jgi:glycosyltransferase involved in cell wall biosynthesis
MDQRITISVIIPAYNAAHFLPRSLASVFAQTLKPQEVIVVDDGSTDNTAAIAAALGATVIRKPNGGLSTARNSGIQNASGDWIALLDADDFWAPEKLERQVALIGPETVLVYTGIQFFDDGGIRGEKPAIDPISARKRLRYANSITPSSVLARREALIRVGGFREDISACEDWEMWCRLQQLGDFEAVANLLTLYFLHSKSLSANPERMLQGLDRIIDKTLLDGMRRFDRWVWRHRILAVQLSSAGLIARDNGLKNELHFMFRSLCAWPSPWWQPKRFALFVVSVRNKLRSLGN